MRTITGRTPYPAPAGELLTRRGIARLGDDAALLRLLADTAIDLAEHAGADQRKVADLRRIARAIGRNTTPAVGVLVVEQPGDLRGPAR